MFRFSLKNLCIVLTIIALLVSCGEDEDTEKDDEEKINQIIMGLKRGYEEKKVDTYTYAFCDNDFLHTSDNGTPDDTFDDLVITSKSQEEQYAKTVFEEFDEIKLEISEPEIKFNSSERAEVTNKYYIQFRSPNDENDEYTYYYAEGENIFTFELGDKGWRIRKWEDKACSPDEIIASIF